MEPGIRVGVIESANSESVKMYGYGIYEGDFEMPDDCMGPFGTWVELQAQLLEAVGLPATTDISELPETSRAALARLRRNPRIRLDSGETIWGCQCWWASEDKVREALDGRTIVMVDPPGKQAAAAETAAEETTVPVTTSQSTETAAEAATE